MKTNENDFIDSNNLDREYLEETADKDFYDILNNLKASSYIEFIQSSNKIKLTIIHNYKPREIKHIDNNTYNREVITDCFSWD